ncbi:DUF4405 domain-containing protein [Allosediminivita pacifica]|uniref:Uncharacterized protein DUF4405 n=1 Tax=Allosediminivita pacifica TaxID=1267769 RepID=A0A2T6A7F8_9RHOB|nr:DUF4405 domain-containing protein [Allosediminivita pacifica]PTX39769.1 uncharacterized protein DUF4405 [Allosediminivita pacifica]GGB26984.1 hypothetical protein GCM10011324_40940 [Allosediminivita pacifica]
MSRWKRPGTRLWLALLTLALLVFCFAYWWLGNLAHEIAGTVMLLALSRHILNNRFWWRQLRAGRWTAERAVTTALTLLVALDVLVLLGTSLAISQSLLAALPRPALFTLREVHWFAAYWLIPLAALHLGLNTGRIGRLLRQVGLPATPRALRLGLCALLCLVALQGLASGGLLGLWPRLGFRYSLAMWDFNAAVWPFFLHWGAVIGLFAGIGLVLASATRRQAR